MYDCCIFFNCLYVKHQPRLWTDHRVDVKTQEHVVCSLCENFIWQWEVASV